MDIDKPLEEIIAASKPKGQRGGRPARGVARGGAQNGTRDRYASNVPRNVPRAAPVKPTSDAFKIIISNLPQDVTEPAVRDLMQSTVGPVRSVQMSYTATGKSTGQATVVFKNRGDANKAHAAYHNRMVDNQRPMKVEIAVDMSTLQSLATRVAPVQQRAPAVRGGRGRGGGAPRPAKRQPKTAEELDAEMSAYKETS